jgi:FkbM family methyltransferase
MTRGPRPAREQRARSSAGRFAAVRKVLDSSGINGPVTTGVRAALRRLPDWNRWAEGYLRRTGVCRVRLPAGASMLMDAGDHSDELTNHLYWHGLDNYEPEVLDVLLALSRDARVVIDVGAHVGSLTMLVALNNPESQIIAFEPVAEVFERLATNVGLNRLSNTMCVRAAVGAGPARLPLYAPLGRVDTVASLSVGHRVTWAAGPWVCELTDVVSLDDFAKEAELDTVDLLKIDVELHEPEVFMGMQGILMQHRPHIICEVLPHGDGAQHRASVIDHVLREHGYFVYVLRPEGPELRPAVVGDPEHWNQLFTTMDPEALASALRR